MQNNFQIAWHVCGMRDDLPFRHITCIQYLNNTQLIWKFVKFCCNFDSSLFPVQIGVFPRAAWIYVILSEVPISFTLYLLSNILNN